MVLHSAMPVSFAVIWPVIKRKKKQTHEKITNKSVDSLLISIESINLNKSEIRTEMPYSIANDCDVSIKCHFDQAAQT